MKLSDLIKKLQAEMNAHGEGLLVDGDPGPKTLAALERFDVALTLTETPLEAPEKPVDHGNLTPALDMIKQFEGLYLSAYLDPIGIPTIGWGTIKYPDGRKVKIGDKITRAQAEEYLMHEVSGFVASVERLVKVKLSNNSFCALVSFCYNLGAGALQKSTMLRKLNGGAPLDEVAKEFDKFVNAGGKPLKGLIRRRAAEKSLFLKPA